MRVSFSFVSEKTSEEERVKDLLLFFSLAKTNCLFDKESKSIK